MSSIDHFQEALSLWEQWWNRDNTSPVAYIIYPSGDHATLDPFVRDWMPAGVTARWDHWKPELMAARAMELDLAQGSTRHLDEWLDYMLAYADLYRHAHGGYRFILPGFGPVCLTAFLSGIFRYEEPTVWLEPDEPMTYGAIIAATQSPPPAARRYRDYAFEMLRRMADRLGGTYLISMPDFGDGMDVLAPLRHNMNLLVEVCDEPQTIQRTLEAVGAFGERMFDRAAAILDPVNAGASACCMRYLAQGRSCLTYCDFSAMIGPDMFAQYVLPMVKRHCARFPGRTVFHLDGPGELPHVEHLCSVDDLFAVQWVQGAGNPDGLDDKWYPLYRQLIDHGKRVCIGTPWQPDRIRALFKAFPAREFALNMRARDAEQAKEMTQFVEGSG